MLPKLHLWPFTIVSLCFFRVCFSPEVLWKFFHSQCGVGCQKHDEKNIGRRRDPLLPPPLGRCAVHRGDAGQKGNFSTRSMDVFVGFTSRYRYLAVGGVARSSRVFLNLSSCSCSSCCCSSSSSCCCCRCCRCRCRCCCCCCCCCCWLNLRSCLP